MKRYYVVFVGRKPGIYTSLSECRDQVRGHKDRKFISYRTLAEAEAAFNDYNSGTLYSTHSTGDTLASDIVSGIAIRSSYDEQSENWSCVGINIETGNALVSVSPMAYATRNLTEFVTVVAALRYCKNRALPDNIYINNITVLNWICNKKREHFIPHHQRNKDLYTAVAIAESWLNENAYINKVLNVDIPSSAGQPV